MTALVRNKNVLITTTFGLLCCLAAGCKPLERKDAIIASVPNPDHTYRATEIRRTYLGSGAIGGNDELLVLVDRYAPEPKYSQGQDFTSSQLALRAGPGNLRVDWIEPTTLQITCENCGFILREKSRVVQQVKVVYRDFPTS